MEWQGRIGAVAARAKELNGRPPIPMHVIFPDPSVPLKLTWTGRLLKTLNYPVSLYRRIKRHFKRPAFDDPLYDVLNQQGIPMKKNEKEKISTAMELVLEETPHARNEDEGSVLPPKVDGRFDVDEYFGTE
jgi:hypothetical protein